MSAQDILTRLSSAPQYHPGSVELFDDITLEPGDIVTVRTGQTDNVMPVYNQRITWNGAAMVTVESTGKETRTQVPPLQRKNKNQSYSQGNATYRVQLDEADLEDLVDTIEGKIDNITASVIVADTVVRAATIEGDNIVGVESVVGAFVGGQEIGWVDPEDGSHIKLDLFAVQIGSNSSGIIQKFYVAGNKETGGPSSLTIPNAVTNLQIIDDPNHAGVKLLQKLTYDSTSATDWSTVGSFSTATSLSGTWNGSDGQPHGVFTVSASPQGNTCFTSLSNTGHWGVAANNEDVNTYYYETKATIDGAATLYDTGNTTQINAIGRYRAGSASVGLNKTHVAADWKNASAAQHPNTLKITTSGRVNASGTADEDEDYLSVSVSTITLSKSAQMYNTSTDAYSNVYAGTYTIGKFSGGVVTIASVTTTREAGVSGLPLSLSLAVPVCDIGTTGTGKWSDSTHQYTYGLKSALTVDSVGNTLVREVRGLTLTPTDAINYGKTLVTVSTAVLSNIVSNASTRSASATLTVTLDNNYSTSITGVDVSRIYQAGLDGDSAISTAPFTFGLYDTNGQFVRNREKSVDVSDVYQRGRDEASTDAYVYAPGNTGRCAWYPQRSGGSRTHWIPHNAKTKLLDASFPTSGRGYVGYYDDERNYVTGYITYSNLHSTARSGYPSPTYGWDDDPPPTPTGTVIKGVYCSGYSGAAMVYIKYANNQSEQFNVYASKSQVDALSYNQGTIESTASEAWADPNSSGWIDLVGRICWAIYSDGTISPGMVIGDPSEW